MVDLQCIRYSEEKKIVNKTSFLMLLYIPFPIEFYKHYISKLLEKSPNLYVNYKKKKKQQKTPKSSKRNQMVAVQILISFQFDSYFSLKCIQEQS